jgi:uracil-DNA glycosylase
MTDATPVYRIKTAQPVGCHLHARRPKLHRATSRQTLRCRSSKKKGAETVRMQQGKLAGGLPSRLPSATAIQGCRRCDLWRDATHGVRGEGPGRGRLMLVGEQPGDSEDRAGRPFVGPAGRVLDELLHEAGADRAGVYVTNAVKHFKWEPRGKRRLHRRPSVGEVNACHAWLEQEIAAVRPRVIVALGATAARSILQRPRAI